MSISLKDTTSTAIGTGRGKKFAKVYNNLNISDADLGSSTQATWQACQADCDLKSNCNSFTFVLPSAGASTGTCYQKAHTHDILNGVTLSGIPSTFSRNSPRLDSLATTGFKYESRVNKNTTDETEIKNIDPMNTGIGPIDTRPYWDFKNNASNKTTVNEGFKSVLGNDRGDIYLTNPTSTYSVGSTGSLGIFVNKSYVPWDMRDSSDRVGTKKCPNIGRVSGASIVSIGKGSGTFGKNTNWYALDLKRCLTAGCLCDSTCPKDYFGTCCLDTSKKWETYPNLIKNADMKCSYQFIDADSYNTFFSKGNYVDGFNSLQDHFIGSNLANSKIDYCESIYLNTADKKVAFDGVFNHVGCKGTVDFNWGKRLVQFIPSTWYTDTSSDGGWGKRIVDLARETGSGFRASNDETINGLITVLNNLNGRDISLYPTAITCLNKLITGAETASLAGQQVVSSIDPRLVNAARTIANSQCGSGNITNKQVCACFNAVNGWDVNTRKSTNKCENLPDAPGCAEVLDWKNLLSSLNTAGTVLTNVGQNSGITTINQMVNTTWDPKVFTGACRTAYEDGTFANTNYTSGNKILQVDSKPNAVVFQTNICSQVNAVLNNSRQYVGGDLQLDCDIRSVNNINYYDVRPTGSLNPITITDDSSQNLANPPNVSTPDGSSINVGIGAPAVDNGARGPGGVPPPPPPVPGPQTNTDNTWIWILVGVLFCFMLLAGGAALLLF
jgi:hypothetical protein